MEIRGSGKFKVTWVQPRGQRAVCRARVRERLKENRSNSLVPEKALDKI